MPQLDKLTYFTQFFWSCLFFFTFYIFIMFYFSFNFEVTVYFFYVTKQKLHRALSILKCFRFLLLRLSFLFCSFFIIGSFLYIIGYEEVFFLYCKKAGFKASLTLVARFFGFQLGILLFLGFLVSTLLGLGAGFQPAMGNGVGPATPNSEQSFPSLPSLDSLPQLPSNEAQHEFSEVHWAGVASGSDAPGEKIGASSRPGGPTTAEPLVNTYIPHMKPKEYYLEEIVKDTTYDPDFKRALIKQEQITSRIDDILGNEGKIIPFHYIRNQADAFLTDIMAMDHRKRMYRLNKILKELSANPQESEIYKDIINKCFL